jgi:hypothetical protein
MNATALLLDAYCLHDVVGYEPDNECAKNAHAADQQQQQFSEENRCRRYRAREG